MRLESLRIVHLLKKHATAEDLAFSLPRAFFIGSCQRSLWICDERELAGVEPSSSFEVFRGVFAYFFLLRVATGLESQVKGETDIFGQVKEAWKKAELAADVRAALSPWIQRIFEDTKEVRAAHLQNLGGVSYGTLVRKLLRDQWDDKKGPILLVGSGQLGQSIAEYLTDYELLIWNRSPESLQQLAATLRPRMGQRLKVLSTSEEELRAWKEAAHAVICIPVSPDSDSRRIELWQQGSKECGKFRPFVHLGGMANQCGAWASVDGFHSLDDIFELQKSQDHFRSLQLAQALRACEERAKLRALGGSITLHHGWEDLAVFA